MDHEFNKDSFGFRTRSITPARGLDCRAMDRRLARRNIRTGLIAAVIALLMFALTFVAALAYVG
jgi:predicted secreted protein